MPIKRKIPYDNGHFFITFTCCNWLPLIEITKGYDLVYNWFNVLKKQGHYITGYVIMPNHIHTTIAFRSSKKGINTIVGDGKRFIARLNEHSGRVMILSNGCRFRADRIYYCNWKMQ